MEVLEINNTGYAYELHQQDDNIPYLLMLHGFMGSRLVFEHLIGELKRYCNPITVDLLGHGDTGKPTNPNRYREEQQMADLLALIDKLAISPLILYGYSMGGRLALQTALSSPDRFNGMILESANCGISNKKERSKRRKIDMERAKKIEHNFNSFLAKWQKLDLFQSPTVVDSDLQETYHHVQAKQYPSALAASLKGFGTGTMTPVCDKLQQWDKPILLLAGTEDEKYQQINNHLVEQFPNATFSSIEAGHRVHLDNPSMLLKKITHFINRIN